MRRVKEWLRRRYVDFKSTLEDATKFGEEICRRFNEFPQDKKL